MESKQAIISLIGVFVSSFIYYNFGWGLFLVLGILFLGSYFQYLYDNYRHKNK